MPVTACLVLLPHSHVCYSKGSTFLFSNGEQWKERLYWIWDFCWQWLKLWSELALSLVCERRERRFENKQNFQCFSKSEETGPTAVSSFPVVFNGNVYKNLVLPLHPREGSCHRDGEWRNLESTSRISQSRGCCWVRRISNMLQKSENFPSALIIRVFSQFWPLKPPNPPLQKCLLNVSGWYLFIKCIRVVSKII